LHAGNLAEFDKVLTGLHSAKFGDLRQVFGLAYRIGKGKRAGQVVTVNASKRDGATIGQPRGKVARRVALAPVVAVEVAGRPLPCAVAVSPVQPWAMLADANGNGGFMAGVKPSKV